MAIKKFTNEECFVKKNTNEYYFADVLHNGAEKVYINMHLPFAYFGKGTWATEVGFYCKSKNHINAVKALLSEIKLKAFDFDKKSFNEQAEFCFSDACPEFGMFLDFNNGRYAQIYVKESLKGALGANLTVRYVDYTERENRTYKCFTALISDKAKHSLIELANDMFDEYVHKLQEIPIKE